VHLPGGRLILRVGIATIPCGRLSSGSKLAKAHRDGAYMNDFRAAGKASELATRDIDPVLSDATAMSDTAAMVAASVVLGLAFLILS
jgi:hypothetical protein